MTPELKLFQLRQQELERVAQQQRQAYEVRRWLLKQTARRTSSDSKLSQLLARISVLF
ncbi:MAG: hypothetical protein SGJ24_04825 [Chloroflexota bacterium]|nr:hypothetical protein [Chloroflexota bacterium]